MTIHTLVLRVAGTNCDRETAEAFQLAGAEAEVCHFNQVAQSPDCLQDYDIIAIPGGFSYGDDIGSGVVFAQQLRSVLRKEVEAFLDRGGLMIGICNGFQVLVKAGLLTAQDGHFEEVPSATLSWNRSARYEDRWVRIQTVGGSSLWTPTEDAIDCPVRHAEGRFVAADEATLKRLEDANQIAFRYIQPDGSPATSYPANPNGSEGAIAGLASKSGQVIGLMPHPECHVAYWQHPHWTRHARSEGEGDGLRVFRNGVSAAVTAKAKA